VNIIASHTRSIPCIISAPYVLTYTYRHVHTCTCYKHYTFYNTATYSRDSLSIDDDHHQTVIYGTKSPSDNVWRFSLPRYRPHSAPIAVHHEQDAELVLYATASLGFPTYKTLYRNQYPTWGGSQTIQGSTPKPSAEMSLTLPPLASDTSSLPAPMFVPPTPSRILSSPLRNTSSLWHTYNLLTIRHSNTLTTTHYDLTDLPDIILLCSLKPSSEFRRDAIYSDLPGAFPVRAKDGTHLLLSVYKGYIHVEPLASRTTAHLCAAYLFTYQFFCNLLPCWTSSFLS
jgi:hypothetical protein